MVNESHRRQHRRPLPRPLPSLRSTVRLNKGTDIWHKPAFSGAVAMAVPNLVLYAAGRLDLALYAAGGALCALYGHDRPYAARARTLVWVVLGMAASVGLALTAASLTRSAAVLVLVTALLAAAQKTLCDATRVGPPGNLIYTFVTATVCFVPQRLTEVPAHVAVTLACGAFSWLVCMAPGLVRPYGPERIATARALEAAARLPHGAAGGGAAVPRARHAALAALHTARHALRPGHAERDRLWLLLHEAEATLAHGTPERTERCAERARALRSGRLPEPSGAAPAAVRPVERSGAARAVLDRLRPGSPLLPVGTRVAVGGALSGWASIALGTGHPYWAVVTATAVLQANTSLTWQRMLQRTLGSLAGLLLFAALVPLARTGPLAIVALAALLQIGAEAFLPRNYWLGLVCVTPLALLLSGLVAGLDAGELAADRCADTLIGAAVGLLVCALVTNRRAADRVEAAVEHVREARAAALAVLERSYGAQEAGRARDRLMASLVELRAAADTADGEWWQRPLPAEPVARAEREAHAVLAALAPCGQPARPAPVG
ncbi:FUSC family protein [Streptomyces gamaensis]|uniref:FUSC family protein n=1 Tax=Streptomyces gamaensis TaxID=1763542 RepID=A0ABW0YYE2_9ACTN